MIGEYEILPLCNVHSERCNSSSVIVNSQVTSRPWRQGNKMLVHRVTTAFLKLNFIFFFLLCCLSFGYTSRRQLEFARIWGLHKVFYQLQKREDFQGDFEQCRFVNSWNRQLGYVNVFAFMDPAWTYSYRQGIMLRMLKKRLKQAGFSDIWFFVILAPEDFPADKAGDEIEMETWKKIYAIDSHNILNSAEVVLDDLQSDTEDDTIFIQDSSVLGIWGSFGATRNQIVTVDRCGKLTYQVIVPWSILYFPYVKAAILSTYKEDPCGPCTIHPILRPMDYEEYLFSNGSLSQGDNVATSLEDNKEKGVFLGNFENKSQPIGSEVDLEKQSNWTDTFFDKTQLIENDAATITTTTKDLNEDTTIYDHYVLNDAGESALSMKQIISVTEINEQDPLVVNENATTLSNTKGTVYESTTFIALPTHDIPRNQVDASPLTLDSSNSKLDKNISESTFSDHWEDANKTGFLPENIREQNTSGPTVGRAQIIPDHEPTEAESTEGSTLKEDSNIIPIRIIMRMPHLHEENGKHKKYTTVILKTGSPDYHEHYETGQDVPTVVGNRNQFNNQTEDEIRDRMLLEYIYNRDESPGLYGEIADYWKNYDDNVYASQNLPDENDTDYKDMTSPSEDALGGDTFQNNNSVFKLTTEIHDDIPESNIKNESSDTDHDVSQVNDNTMDPGIKDDEAKQKLINHYQKLLPWVYYVL